MESQSSALSDPCLVKHFCPLPEELRDLALHFEYLKQNGMFQISKNSIIKTGESSDPKCQLSKRSTNKEKKDSKGSLGIAIWRGASVTRHEN